MVKKILFLLGGVAAGIGLTLAAARFLPYDQFDFTDHDFLP